MKNIYIKYFVLIFLFILKEIKDKLSLFPKVIIFIKHHRIIGYFNFIFLKKKINFSNIIIVLNKILGMKIFLKYKKISPKNYNEIIKLSDYVRLKTRLLCI